MRNNRKRRQVFDSVRKPFAPFRPAQVRRRILKPLFERPYVSTFQGKRRMSAMRNMRRTANIFTRAGYVASRIVGNPLRVLDRDCRREWSRLLSWRASQSGKRKSGKGGGVRKRKPRSQREKAASAAKHYKDC